MSLNLDQDVKQGQAIYSKAVLSIYDLLVLGLSNHVIWKCPTSRLLDFYNEHISSNHMDVGVGTGYFLDCCTFSEKPRVVLVDLNENSLKTTAKKIWRYSPKIYCRNILEPLEIEEDKFDSIGMNYLLHCLPGDIHTKSIAFDRVVEYLNLDGVVFGSTLLQDGVQRSGVAQQLMNFYNKRGIFCNVEDALEELKHSLACRFRKSQVEVVGCAALFWARDSYSVP